MALEIVKQITLNGNAKIEDEIVVQMSSTISSDILGGTGYTEYIISNETYLANLVEIRANIKAFKEAVYKIEDEVLADSIVLP